ncbi:MAG: DUF4982 domain-containing protein, partial [Opitutaceae bacterium]|nr:DUF4982 domain-containing protein [Opitutaceae bacterium]
STSGGRVETEVARASGEVDAVRLPKEAYHVLQTLWTETPRAHILGHWTYPARTKKTIHVVANAGADDVELLLNGKTLGHAKPAQTCLFTFPDIAFDPGALTAISRRAGQKLAAHTLRTAGPAVALRMTPIENPAGGLTAGGSDIALIDVEAVDADGNRCPTWQNRVDFTLTGPAVWRGGYNSGKPDSINNTWLDLESGINRVAIKSTPDAGQITLKASRTGLKDATLTLTSTAPPLTTAALPPTSAARAVAHSLARTPGGASILPDEKLPQTAPAWENTPALATPQPPLVKSAATGAEKMAGRHTKTWSYSGPSSAIVHLETDARPGKNAYVDTDSPFPADLPAALESADWIQAANSDALYSAVDFVEISVPANTTITVAHDDRLPRPGWLTAQFKATPQKITILGNAMTLHERAAKTPESITMGDNAAPKTAPAHPNMYLVFVNKK